VNNQRNFLDGFNKLATMSMLFCFPCSHFESIVIRLKALRQWVWPRHSTTC